MNRVHRPERRATDQRAAHLAQLAAQADHARLAQQRRLQQRHRMRDDLHIGPPKQRLARFKTRRPRIDQHARARRHQRRRCLRNRHLGRALTIDALIEGNFRTRVRRIENAPMHSNQVTRLLQLAQVTPQRGR